MTARRRARAAQAAPAVLIDGAPVPAELADAAHPLWHDQGRYRAYMRRHGWTMPAADRLEGAGTHPANRRARAAYGWARAQGLALDWHQLHAHGLCH